MVSRTDIELANRRGEQMRRDFPHAISARYDRSSKKIVIDLSSKLTLSFSPRDAQGLEDAQPAELEFFRQMHRLDDGRHQMISAKRRSARRKM